MDCLHPIYVRNKNFVRGESMTDMYKLVPCGKCVVCRQKNQKDWIFRLQAEQHNCPQCIFVTYTYDDDHVRLKNGVPTVCKRDMQLYLKRLRKRFPAGTLRYFLVSEYGSKTHRPHYHAILFNYSNLDLRDFVDLDWQNGFVDIGTVTDASIAYTLKYCLKGSEVPPGAENTFTLSSRRPGIGFCYLEDSATYNTMIANGVVTQIGGYKQRIPRFYRDKMRDDLVKESGKSILDRVTDTYGDLLEYKKRAAVYSKNRMQRLSNNENL